MVLCDGFDVPIYETDLDFWGVEHVSINTETKELNSYGYANAKWNIEHSSDSRFAIGSNTKLFASAGMLQLEEKGILNLSKSITEYIDVEKLHTL